MTEQTGTHTSGAKKGILGGAGAALGVYVLAPIAVQVAMGGVPPESPLARVIDTLYPRQVSNRLIDAPVPQATVAALPILAPAMATPTQAAPVAAAPADTSIAMTATPADAPLKARVEPPVLRDQDSYYVNYSMTLISAVDALPVFTTSNNSRLEGWSATVKPSNANCSVGMFNANGLSSYYGADNWRSKADDMTKLGKDIGMSVTGTIQCSEKVHAGDTITLSARVNYVANGTRVPVAFYSPAMTLGPKQ